MSYKVNAIRDNYENIGRTHLQRLTPLEFSRTLSFALDLKDSSTKEIYRSLPPVTKDSTTFSNTGETQSFLTGNLQTYYEVALGAAIEFCSKQRCENFESEAVRTAMSRMLAWRVSPANSKIIIDELRESATDYSIPAILATLATSPSVMYKSSDRDINRNATERELTAGELITRLTFLLWGAAPGHLEFQPELDEKGRFLNMSAYQNALDQIIDNPKIKGFVDGFVHEWLDLEFIEDNLPEDPELAKQLYDEIRQYFYLIIRSDSPFLHLLDSKWAALENKRIYSSELTGNTLGPMIADDPNSFMYILNTESERRGILGLPGILTATSVAGRTSFTRRGSFIFRKLLCDDIEAPPPDADQKFGEIVGGKKGDTPEQRVAQHLELLKHNQLNCYDCHRRMDPAGFILEGFNKVGAKTKKPPNAQENGQLNFGTVATPITRLSELTGHPLVRERFAMCFSKNLLTYALGRRLKTEQTHPDQLLLKDMSSQFLKNINEGGSSKTYLKKMLSSKVFTGTQLASETGNQNEEVTGDNSAIADSTQSKSTCIPTESVTITCSNSKCHNTDEERLKAFDTKKWDSIDKKVTFKDSGASMPPGSELTTDQTHLLKEYYDKCNN